MTMASVEDENCLSSYRKLLVDLSFNLSSREVETLNLVGVDFIPRGTTEKIYSGLQFFDVLEQDGRIGPQNLALLHDMFKTIGRMDLAQKIKAFLTVSVNDETDAVLIGPLPNDRMQWQHLTDAELVPDGPGDDPPPNDLEDGSRCTGHSREIAAEQLEATQQVCQLLHSADHTGAVTSAKRAGQEATASQIINCLAAVGYTSCDGNQGSAPSGPQTGQQRGAQAQGSSSGRIKPVGPEPVRYVNFLACKGYTLEIIGGKHFKTPEGEFVEMKSGTQYKIHVKNTHAYGCTLDISIDGYDVGGWVVDGGQEFTIERPAYEAKKFTFYRVKTAPKEAGIESGRPENGVVKCLLTPEAFLNIAVIISGLPQPLDMNMPPSATVGDLKREVQRQLNASDDPDQVLCSDNTVLLNSSSVRNLPPGGVRLIDTELEIVIEASSKEIFPIKIHPGRAKVRDIMEQIERKLQVPIKDQKLYHGRTRLSDAPRSGLPDGVTCSPQPTVVVIVPEYIHITVEDQNGYSHEIKIDKEKSLTALMEEIPSCNNLQENEEAVFYFNGKQLSPQPKDEGTLTSLGICSGTKLELKVKTAFIKLSVEAWNFSVSVRCSPQETFKDLVEKVEMEGLKREEKKVTFSMKERVFDPEQDTGPLQEYGITHGSVLQLKMDKSQSVTASNYSERPGDANDLMPEEDGEAMLVNTLAAGVKRIKDRTMEISFTEDQLMAISFTEGGDKSIGHVKYSGCQSQGADGAELQRLQSEQGSGRVTEPDPAWRAGGTTLQGYSSQQFMTAEPIKVDPSRKVELVLRLVAREDEEGIVFPEDGFTPLSTLHPPPVPE
ncbi:hypothetical protein ACROYT_G013584 [Oculina patagonica]